MRGFSSAASARSSGARTSSRGAFSGDGADHDHGSQVHHLCVRSPVLPIAPGDLAMIQALRWTFASKLSTGANSLRLVGSRGVRHFALTLTGGDVSALASRTELGSRCSFCSGGFFKSQLSPGPHLCPACVATSVLKHSFHSDDRNSEGPADPNGGKVAARRRGVGSIRASPKYSAPALLRRFARAVVSRIGLCGRHFLYRYSRHAEVFRFSFICSGRLTAKLYARCLTKDHL